MKKAHTIQPPKSIVIAPSSLHGRGVFAVGAFVVGDVIETCPLILVPNAQRQHIDRTALYDYYFGWGKNREISAFALGYGSIYNHSYEPNARCVRNEADETISFVCLRPIAVGDEINHNYNGDPSDRTPVWFEKK